MLCVCVILLPPDLIYSDFALMGSSTGGPDCSACSCPVAGDHSSSKAGSKRHTIALAMTVAFSKKFAPQKSSNKMRMSRNFPRMFL